MKIKIYFAAFLTHASSVLTTLFTFGVYFWLEERHLDAGSVFASLALCSQLTVPLFIFPVIFPIIINAKVEVKKIIITQTKIIYFAISNSYLSNKNFIYFRYQLKDWRITYPCLKLIMSCQKSIETVFL